MTTAALILAAAALSTPAELSRLADDLGDADYAVRRAAQRQLVEQAATRPAWWPHVGRLAESHPDAEARNRFTVAAGSIEEYRRFGPSRVTLIVRHATPRAAAEAFAEAVRRTLPADGSATEVAVDSEARGDEARRVDLELREADFWDAVAEVGRATGYWPANHGRGDDGSFFLSRRGSGATAGHPTADDDRPVIRRVAARVDLAGASLVVNANGRFRAGEAGGIELADGNAGATLQVSLRLLIEPKLRPAGEARVVVDEAIDGAGDDVLRERGSGERVDSWNETVSIRLDRPADALGEPRLRRLAGRVELDVVDRYEQSQVVVVAPGTAESGGDRPMEVEFGPESDGRIGAEVRVEVDDDARRGGRPFPSPESLAFVGTDGRRWAGQFGGVDRERGEAGRSFWVVSLSFRRPEGSDAAPATLTWHRPSSTRALVVPFAFEDVPLPPLPAE